MRVGRVIGPVAVVGVLLATALTVLGLNGRGQTGAARSFPSVDPTPLVYLPTTSGPAATTQATHQSSAPRAARSSGRPTPAHSRPAPSVAPVPVHRTPAPLGRAALPVPGATGDATQVITVQAPSADSTQATVQAWSRVGARWVAVGASVPAWVGDAGLTTNAREGYDGTPIGSFGLTHAFGNDPDPGTALPYFHADADDWWSGDISSPTYNTHQRCVPSACPFDTSASENLHDAGWVYGYAVVIDYNTPAVSGKGSAFFLHVTQNSPTQGCVSIPQHQLVRIMRWLDPRQHPRIVIGVA